LRGKEIRLCKPSVSPRGRVAGGNKKVPKRKRVINWNQSAREVDGPPKAQKKKISMEPSSVRSVKKVGGFLGNNEGKGTPHIPSTKKAEKKITRQKGMREKKTQ